MFLVYYISVSTLGTVLTDWANDGLFGDGWHLFGIGNSAYEEDMDATLKNISLPRKQCVLLKQQPLQMSRRRRRPRCYGRWQLWRFRGGV